MAWWIVGAQVAGSLGGGYLAAEGSKEAAEAGAEGQKEASRIIKEQTEKARESIFQLVPVGERNLLTGKQAALDVLGQSIPGQIDLSRGGNIAAQQTLLASMPQLQNAILGKKIDLSGMQAYQGAPVPDINYQLPEFESAITPEMQAIGQEDKEAEAQLDAEIISVYQEMLGRDPDPGGFISSRDLVTGRSGVSSPRGLDRLRRNIMGSTEYKDLQVGV